MVFFALDLLCSPSPKWSGGGRGMLFDQGGLGMGWSSLSLAFSFPFPFRLFSISLSCSLPRSFSDPARELELGREGPETAPAPDEDAPACLIILNSKLVFCFRIRGGSASLFLFSDDEGSDSSALPTLLWASDMVGEKREGNCATAV